MIISIKNDIIDEIRLSTMSSGVSVIMGSNASGKTTLLNNIAGLVMPREGYIKYDDNYCFDFPMKIPQYFLWKKFIRKNLVYVDSTSWLLNDLSLKDNLKYFCYFCGLKNDDIKLYFEKFNVHESDGKLISNVSEGTKQKIMLSIVLSSSKKYILMDEPEKDVDINTISDIYTTLNDLNEKQIIISSHQKLETLNQYFDNIYLISEGEMNKL